MGSGFSSFCPAIFSFLIFHTLGQSNNANKARSWFVKLSNHGYMGFRAAVGFDVNVAQHCFDRVILGGLAKHKGGRRGSAMRLRDIG
ncbi:hypothetical protein GGI35DRAFT_414627 [Trichoderma velutinum]